MVRIEQDCDLYFRGGKAPCAFVDLRLYTPAPAEAKRAFAAALTRELCERFELEPDFVYMNMLELDHWVSGGGISFAPGQAANTRSRVSSAGEKPLELSRTRQAMRPCAPTPRCAGS